jgi:cystathionine beta-lyase family protein involved in aluminum resistance
LLPRVDPTELKRELKHVGRQISNLLRLAEKADGVAREHASEVADAAAKEAAVAAYDAVYSTVYGAAYMETYDRVLAEASQQSSEAERPRQVRGVLRCASCGSLALRAGQTLVSPSGENA